jgi:glutamate/tyrosine decarboxylase-like PLP-dependent enzyme
VFAEAQEAISRTFEYAGPGYLAYIPGGGLYTAALADFIAQGVNRYVGLWQPSPAVVQIEENVTRWLCDMFDYPEGSQGLLLSGGSMANLSAMVTARHAKLGEDFTDGVYYVSEQAHASVPKAATIAGFSKRNVRIVATDDELRMDPEALRTQIARDRADGLRPFLVAPSVGTTNTGAIDPIADIADIAEAEDLWLHVDGAYGALAALAVPERLAGLALADSLSVDAHKWLYQPLDCSALLYRDAEIARQSFAYTGDYAKSLSADPVEGFAFFEESIELSRRFRALKLWLSLRYHGLGQFRQAIGNDLRHGQLLAELIEAEPSLELLAPVELSAVCFRWTGGSAATLDERNQQILQRVVRRGRVLLSNATLGGRFALRACIVNHRTTDQDVTAVIQEVLAAARETA